MNTQKRAIMGLYAISFVLALPYMTNSLLAYIMASYPGVPETTAHSILTMPYLVGLFLSFAVGPLAMRVGKKLLMGVGVLTIWVYFLIFAVVGGRGPFELLLVGAGIAGVNQGAFITLLSSSVGEFFEASARPVYLAVTRAISNGGAALLSVVGGKIAAGSGGADWPYAYYCGIIILPILIFYLFIMPGAPDAPPAADAAVKDPKEARKDRLPMKAVLAAVLQGLAFLSTCALNYNLSVYIIAEYRLGTSAHAGVAGAIITMSGVVVGFTYSIWSKVLGRWIPAAGYLLMTLGLCAMMLINTTLWGAYLGALLLGVGLNLSVPYTIAYITAVTPARLVPAALSIYAGMVNIFSYASVYILSFLGALLGGGVFHKLLIGAVCAFVCAVTAAAVYAPPKKTGW